MVYSNGILRTHNEFKVTGPSVVTGRSGTIGQVTFINKNCWPHNTSLWVTDFCGNDPKFIYYFFIQIRLKKYNAGSSIPTLNRNDVHSIKASIPESLKEQQKIATFLSSVDTKIEQLGKKIALLEQYKKGMMQKLFSQEIRFKDEQGNEYPDWEERRISQIARIYRGMGLSKSATIPNGKHPCILYGELFTKYTETITRVSAFTNVEPKVTSKFGDILMPTSDVTPDGLATASALLVEGVQIGGDINVVRLHEDQNSVFISYLINFCKREILKIVTGTTVKHIYAKDVKSIKLTIPKSQQEQQKIADFLSAIDKKIELVAQQLEQARAFKKGLLQQMFI